ncbi:MAG: TlyA family rRNA (cytidine-2'-O)-methyltransferase [Alphaproteobacteria bacterium]|nr:TlyA family rRNA (cytidine-2'-O)-methyltransferase [Alphaproteobacteria bacterium]
MKKQRADLALVARGLAADEKKARALIMAGEVLAGTRRIDKPSETVAPEDDLHLREKPHPYVSRGGIKLAAALDHFAVDPAGLVCLDVGSSTGGFTDVLLQRGAARVYAVDSGTHQLHEKLRADPRVILHEKTSARILTRDHVPEAPQLVVADVSFMPLAEILPAPLALAAPGAALVALVKPQFEAARTDIGPGGVVRDTAVHAAACDTVARWLGQQGWQVGGILPSPITGADGNREFLLAAKRK